VVNGVEFNPSFGNDWVHTNLNVPTISTTSGQDGVFRAKVTNVPTNSVGYNMYLPTAISGNWAADAEKSSIFPRYGINPYDAEGPVNLEVMGYPDNSTFLRKVETHEGVHANDINRAINTILVPWDASLQRLMDSSAEFEGSTQEEAESTLWAAVGGTALQIANRLDAQWTTDNNAYHASRDGESDIGEIEYDAQSNTVRIPVMLHQPLTDSHLKKPKSQCTIL
jgi:hypothetical protein